MSKPKVITKCVANAYTDDTERIVEFVTSEGGGLISVKVTPRGTVMVSVYRTDPSVEVVVGKSDGGAPTPVWRNGIELVEGSEVVR